MTGSGITLDALVREAQRRGWDQHVLCGLPVKQPTPAVGGLPAERVLAVRFGPQGHLPFPVPGMSDVMPYPSTIWSKMTREQLDRYRAVWRLQVRRTIEAVQPDVVHVNHLWVLGALVKDACEDRPSVLHCHGTGLRQLELCPLLVKEVIAGNRRHDRVLALHDAQAATIREVLGVTSDRVHVVGAGFQEEIFHAAPAANDASRAGHALYAGKLADAKGLPWLLNAVGKATAARGPFTLHVAGDGQGPEAMSLRARMAALAHQVHFHGLLEQPALADLMRRCAVFVLPSLYEGLPLVLVEARACGCRLVATDLPGIRERLLPVLGDDLTLVPPPRLVNADQPMREDLPAFTEHLAAALAAALDREPVEPGDDILTPFTWRAVFARVEAVWDRLLGEAPPLADEGHPL
jgi:glycosyltransferase involved in cell wall biosynthesis